MMYPTARKGIEETNRALLEKLHAKATGPLTAADAASLLGLDLARTRRLLAYLAGRGWLSRVRHGLYTTVPLGATSPSEWRGDPWVVAATAFAPCYIGGFSACEHWGLTDQIFRDIVIITGAAQRETSVTIQDTVFRLKFQSQKKHFGTRPVWRGQTKVSVSDASRTVVDILDNPRLGGGIRHVGEVVASYFDGEHRDDYRLFDYAMRVGMRAVFKRLGFIVETMRIDAPSVVERCLSALSSGVSSLDPSISTKGHITKRWNLRVNVALNPREEMRDHYTDSRWRPQPSQAARCAGLSDIPGAQSSRLFSPGPAVPTP